jgi:hypothetical protein
MQQFHSSRRATRAVTDRVFAAGLAVLTAAVALAAAALTGSAANAATPPPAAFGSPPAAGPRGYIGKPGRAFRLGAQDAAASPLRFTVTSVEKDALGRTLMRFTVDAPASGRGGAVRVRPAGADSAAGEVRVSAAPGRQARGTAVVPAAGGAEVHVAAADGGTAVRYRTRDLYAAAFAAARLRRAASASLPADRP